ncbi:MAG TPA: hypothetical protein VNC50_15155, partial [Planctomycetia bacterium]|nr:hypothetical protein [Planctomycetia bacterium]
TLALVLVKQRALKLQAVEFADGREVLVLRVGRGKPAFRIANPGLSEPELQRWEAEIEKALATDERAGYEPG